MRALCERCGSISVVRGKPESADRLVAFFTAKRPFVCRRCGWRGRRDWSDADLSRLKDYGAGGAGGAQLHPALAVLDREHKEDGELTQHQFDLAALDLAGSTESQRDLTEGLQRRKGRSRKKRSRRREIVAIVAATALVMFVVVMLGLTRRCSGGPEAF